MSKTGQRKKEGWQSRLVRRLRKLLAPSRRAGADGSRLLDFQFQRFREILNLNDSLLKLFAEIEEKASGRRSFAYEPLADRIRRSQLDLFVMVKALNQLADGRYNDLYEALDRIGDEVRDAEEPPGEPGAAPLVLDLNGLQTTDVPMAGSKMAVLGEIRSLGLPVPDGFVVTSAAFRRLMEHGSLAQRAASLEGLYETHGWEALEDAGREVQNALMTCALPAELESAILGALDSIFKGTAVRVAVRSSARGEDRPSVSHAGQYLTLLDINREGLADAYRRVVASAFTPQAVLYRYQHGLSIDDAAMAVGVLQMVQPRCSGVMFTRDFRDSGLDRIRISAVAGLGESLVAGRRDAEELSLSAGSPLPASHLLLRDDLAALSQLGRKLEDHFGCPQDIEWSIDSSGRLIVLQSRPMTVAREPARAEPLPAGREVILAGGSCACPGIGSGHVFRAAPGRDISQLPENSILVLRQASASYSIFFSRCAAVIAEIGSPSGHMAILCRESGVPCIVGMKGAFDALEDGRMATVDASELSIIEGHTGTASGRRLERNRLAGSPAVERLRRIVPGIAPLHLADPSSPQFRPGACRTFHDVVRFVHEKLYEAMFRFGEQAGRDRIRSRKLSVRLPMPVLVLDVGGGLVESVPDKPGIEVQDVLCRPLRAFLEGLLDPRIRWDRPRAVSAGGFASVVGESLMGPPVDPRQMGEPTFAVISGQYMNFSAKAGYHFANVDTVLSPVQNKNYIHFRFGGGGAGEERRLRRAVFLWKILSSMGFLVNVKGDMVLAKMEKPEEEELCSRLVQLGRLTLCSRQLDMLMDSEASADRFSAAFLEENFDPF